MLMKLKCHDASTSTKNHLGIEITVRFSHQVETCPVSRLRWVQKFEPNICVSTASRDFPSMSLKSEYVSFSCQVGTLTIGSQKFLITIDFIDSARNINFDLKIDISRSKSRNLNFFDIGANIEISILKYRNLNFEISESQF